MTTTDNRCDSLFTFLALAALALAGCEVPTEGPPAERDSHGSTGGVFRIAAPGLDGPGPRMALTASAIDEQPDTDADPDTDTDADPDTDSDPDTDPDTDTDPDPALAQQPPVWDGDFSASTNAELEEFCALGFTRVVGDVTIGGDVEDVAGMECLEWVGGDLVVSFAPALVELEGFFALEEVGGDLQLSNLPGLVELVGFDSLTSLGGSLALQECRRLQTVEMMPNLQEIKGDVSLRWNDEVASLVLLEDLRVIGGDYVAERFGRTEGLPVLPGLSEVAGDVSILDNLGLVSLDQLHVLEKIGGDLTIDGNYALGDAIAEEAAVIVADRVGGKITLGRNGG